MKTHSRRGASLIELVVVIGVSSVMVGIAVTSIHRLLSAEREHERTVRSVVQLSRLSRQFREDVHGAVEAEIASEADTALKLATSPNASIVYTVQEAALTRVSTDAEGHTHREVYRFPRETRFAFSRDANTPLVRLTIEVPRSPTSQPAPGLARPRAAVLDSHLGLNRRLTGATR